MDFWIQMIITIVCSVLASSGLWTYISKRSERMDSKTELLLGIAHDRIMFLATSYIDRGYITKDEYENLYAYLYQPYQKNGGNGSAEHIMKQVDKLPIQKIDSSILAELSLK